MPTNYTGNPTATEAPSTAPGPGVAPVVVIPNDGEGATHASIVQAFQVFADFIAWLTKCTTGPIGDSSDGTVTLDGTVAAPSGMTKSGSVYTATRDLYFSNLTVTGASTQLNMANYRLYVANVLTTAGGAFIHNNGISGGNATSTVGGTAGSPSLGYLITPGGAGNGGGGSTGGGGPSAGSNGSAAAAQYGYSGAGGGGGSAAPGASSGAGGAAPSSAVIISLKPYSAAIFGSFLLPNGATGVAAVQMLAGGSGGGGGGGGGTSGSNGGGGGAGGTGAGVLAVVARQVVLANAIDLRAIGGAGGAGYSYAANYSGGGGGGGGGGTILLAYGTLTITAGSFSNSANCAGGAGGAAGGSGGNSGSAGGNGQIIQVALT